MAPRVGRVARNGGTLGWAQASGPAGVRTAIDGRPTRLERRSYLTRLDGGIERLARAVCGHWGIENRRHWSLDVVFHEDDSRLRKGHAPENMTVFRKIALNLLAQESSKGAKKTKRLKAAWDNDFLLQVLLA